MSFKEKRIITIRINQSVPDPETGDRRRRSTML